MNWPGEGRRRSLASSESCADVEVAGNDEYRYVTERDRSAAGAVTREASDNEVAESLQSLTPRRSRLPASTLLATLTFLARQRAYSTRR